MLVHKIFQKNQPILWLHEIWNCMKIIIYADTFQKFGSPSTKQANWLKSIGFILITKNKGNFSTTV